MRLETVESVDRERAGGAFKYLLKSEAILKKEFDDIIPSNVFPDAQITQEVRIAEGTEADACYEANLFGWGRGKDRIGAAHIFEGVAKLAERDHRIIKDLKQLPEYAFLYFAHFLLPVLAEYDEAGVAIVVGGMPKWRVDLSTERFVLFARAFLAICDLALFVPIGPIYGPLRERVPAAGLLWEQIHPGYRVLYGLTRITKVAP